MSDLTVLLYFLSDGEFHSGECLAAELGVSRTAIWKQVKKINDKYSIKIESIARKGYRLEKSLQFLNQAELISKINDNQIIHQKNVSVLLECSSTNQFLLERINKNQLDSHLVVAEMQTQGRGRRGRQWVSPFASNIYMSLLWPLNISMAEISGLSLVVAISTAKALQSIGISDVMLKWPNDIYVDNKKIAGVLLELRGESNSPCHAVIGIGVNVDMPKSSGASIDQDWVDIKNKLNKTINRNDLVAEIIKQLIQRLDKFSQEGFKAFIDEWSELDLLYGKDISIDGHMTLQKGVAKGVDKYGALLVESSSEVHSLYSGEVSIRKIH